MLGAAEGGTDLGLLLVSLSTFLIAGALLFVCLFQALAVTRRAEEWWTLSAMGLSRASVRCVVLLEGLSVAVLGGVLGATFAQFYCLLVLPHLPAVVDASIAGGEIPLQGRTVALGLSLNVAISFVAMATALARVGPTTTGRACESRIVAQSARNRRRLACATVGLIVAGLLGTWPAAEPRGRALLSGTAGALALIAGILGSVALLQAAGRRAGHSVAGLGLSNLARAPRRSAAVVGVLAMAVFVVSLVALGGGTSSLHGSVRQSGTGGFAYIGETALPLRHDPDQESARRALGLPPALPARIVPMRVRDGDDASCRNLSRVVAPRIVGVDPAQLASRDAFSFSGTMRGVRARRSWRVLDEDLGDGTVPAVADDNVIAWALRRTLGDVVAVIDGQGKPLRLRLVAALEPSVLQGSVVISERAFEGRFPAIVGYRSFLVDVDERHRDTVAGARGAALRDYGLDLTPAAERLADLSAVENAYRSLFLALGVLGLVFGMVGCGAIVARDLTERSGEIAVLRAMGFGVADVDRLLISEHGSLFVLAAVAGAVAAAIARGPGASASAYGAVALVCVAVVVSGAAALRLASRWSCRQHPSVLARE